ncbi:MAG: ribonuclease III [Deltaproteobacteria bacterium]|nr:ribonuclease III [Deltaproteobacteria bacterium]
MTMTKEEKTALKIFEKKLGYAFKKIAFLKQALTHKSYTNEMKLSPQDHNERLEFLGDAVLELSVSHLLVENYPDAPEGDLSKWRAAIVNESKLAELAGKIDLGKHLFLGKGEDLSGGREKPSLVSDAFEAVLGAIFIDRGFKKATAVVEKHFSKIVAEIGEEGFAKDYKTRFQEMVQSKFRTVPRYELVNTVGPDHKKTFEVNLYVGNELVGVGKGMTKKGAEQDAAQNALRKT